uniref:BHLH domain-containing protein n=1 Tax=Oryza punctata TaxID=4537 RepID=A0A0E0JD46_ORYPU
MASSSSSSSLCDNNLLQDDLPWPSMPFAPAPHTFGLNHQWSQPPMLSSSTDELSSYELESLQSVQSQLLAAAPPTLSPHLQAHQLSTVVMMQELGFQWSSCAAPTDHHNIASSMNNNVMMNEEELRRRPDQSLISNPRSCGATTPTTDMVLPPPHLAASLDGVVLPSINVSRLQKPTGAGDEPPQICCKRQAAARDEHEPCPYGPPAHLIQGPSHSHTLQMERNTDAAAQGSSALPPSSKKPRLESSAVAMVPSFKVRKEKLGDRIAALQQLVSPFGKTDTASVLMEAIGYIKFLQDQVETLSGPYLRSSKNSKKLTCRAAQPQRGASNGGEAAAKLDLRSRGLCLVPLSCTSYVTNENGVWPPPNFRGN